MIDLFRACGEMSVLIMGASFIFGALFTVLILLVLDMLKARRTGSFDD